MCVERDRITERQEREFGLVCWLCGDCYLGCLAKVWIIEVSDLCNVFKSSYFR